jgi:hypothetical protein
MACNQYRAWQCVSLHRTGAQPGLCVRGGGCVDLGRGSFGGLAAVCAFISSTINLEAMHIVLSAPCKDKGESMVGQARPWLWCRSLLTDAISTVVAEISIQTAGVMPWRSSGCLESRSGWLFWLFTRQADRVGITSALGDWDTCYPLAICGLYCRYGTV